ncbi:MAG: 5-(carboxyamino)imidazole ribonucleotide synthase [Rickettsiales bacterium]|jgi:5-(carboxyamino)imidazole ribonucleotide synthase
MLNKKSKKPLAPNSTIGIFGGGQLGQMTARAANQLGYRVIVFSDVSDCPASFATNQTIVADYSDQKSLQEFADKIDVATFEFENIPVQAVDFVAKQKPVYPNSDVLRITQNRLKEKNFLNQISVKTTQYYAINSLSDLENNFPQKDNSRAILKTTTMGYDGKGQEILDQNSDLPKIWQKFSRELILENFVNYSDEISVIVTKGIDGEVSCFEPLKNIHQDGILRKSIYPSGVSKKTKEQALKIANNIATEIDLVGVLAVEFFVLQDGSLLVNELAPRPHNSGHFSMDASKNSQFDQLIRAICGLPLGNSDFHTKGYMQNLIGDDVLKIDEFLENKNTKLHLYGKEKIAEGRKMGHVNFLE